VQRWTQATVELAAGDVLLMFSDGLVEAARADGEERLRTLILGLNERDPDAMRTRILDSLRAFIGTAELHDDLTLVVAAFDAPAELSAVSCQPPDLELTADS
jgi:serine phosphatase RsbU (regulator of sigma subunit)